MNARANKEARDEFGEESSEFRNDPWPFLWKVEYLFASTMTQKPYGLILDDITKMKFPYDWMLNHVVNVDGKTVGKYNPTQEDLDDIADDLLDLFHSLNDDNKSDNRNTVDDRDER